MAIRPTSFAIIACAALLGCGDPSGAPPGADPTHQIDARAPAATAKPHMGIGGPPSTAGNGASGAAPLAAQPQ